MVADYRDVVIQDLSADNVELTSQIHQLEADKHVLRLFNSELLAAIHDAIKDPAAWERRQRAFKMFNHESAERFAAEIYAVRTPDMVPA